MIKIGDVIFVQNKGICKVENITKNAFAGCDKTKEYYVIPGGGQDEGETLEETVIRELKEEMNIDIKVLGYLGNSIWEDSNSNFFHCEIINGIPTLGGEELERMKEQNYYEPMFVDISSLEDINIIGTDFIQKALKKEYIKIKGQI